jgi:hypothetical protein
MSFPLPHHRVQRLTVTCRATFHSQVKDLSHTLRYDHLLCHLRAAFHLEDDKEEDVLIFYADDNYTAAQPGEERLRIQDQESLSHAVNFALSHTASTAMELLVPITVELSAYASANADLQSFYEPCTPVSPTTSLLVNIQKRLLQKVQDTRNLQLLAAQRGSTVQAMEEKAEMAEEVSAAFRAGAVEVKEEVYVQFDTEGVDNGVEAVQCDTGSCCCVLRRRRLSE